MRFCFLSAALAAATLFIGASTASAQTLYGVDQFGLTLHEVDPATGVSNTMLATLTEATDGIFFANGLAMNPATGVMHLCYQDNNGGAWRIGTVDLVTGVITPVVLLGSESPRDATFDGAGNLWVVFGQVATNPHSVNTVDLGTGAITPQITTPPTDRNKIAYDQVNDVMYLLGNNGGSAEMNSFDPAIPSALTNVPLSGDPLVTSSNPPLVYDRINDLLRTANTAATWRTITRAGVVADPGSTSAGWGGLAYDQATTQAGSTAVATWASYE